MSVTLDAKIPAGPIEDKWDSYKDDVKLVNPNNKRKFKVLVVGTGLAGASAAATLAELGYQVDAFTFHDSPRRAHSIAAQGGINAAKNYRGDGDSIHRLFYDTVKGGDFRAREGNVHRLAQVSVDIIDQMVAQGVPFAREYGGLLDNRSFGGAQVSRTFYARGQTGQQLLLGAYQQLARQIGLGGVRLFNRVELVDTVVIDGRCAGIVTRDLMTGEFQSHAGDAVVLATGGFLTSRCTGASWSALIANSADRPPSTQVPARSMNACPAMTNTTAGPYRATCAASVRAMRLRDPEMLIGRSATRLAPGAMTATPRACTGSRNSRRHLLDDVPEGSSRSHFH